MLDSPMSVPTRAFEGRSLGTGQVTGQIYRFAIGVLNLSLDLDLDFDECVRLSSATDQIEVDGQVIADFAESFVKGIIGSARKFATYSYERRLEDRELYPLFTIREVMEGEASPLIARHHKALFGSVAEEGDYDRLSPRVLEREPLKNLALLGG